LLSQIYILRCCFVGDRAVFEIVGDLLPAEEMKDRDNKKLVSPSRY
jgi:hypothetical protein